MAVDLHIHSTMSDGTLTPDQIVRVAQQKNLTAIAITDHDALAGVAPAIQAAEGSTLQVLPAVEISTEYHSAEVHILGYFIDTQAPNLLEKLKKIRAARRDRARRIAQKLTDLGLAITYEQIAAEAGEGSIGRPHVAATLVKAGYVQTSQEAFSRYLIPGRPAYVPRYRLKPSAAIQEIIQAGGLAVLAHPGIDNAQQYVDELMQYGLGGLEAYHTNHSPARTRQFLQLAQRLGLLITGGTDSHGPGGTMPVEIGSVAVPDKCFQRLLQWAEQHGRVGLPPRTAK